MNVLTESPTKPYHDRLSSGNQPQQPQPQQQQQQQQTRQHQVRRYPDVVSHPGAHFDDGDEMNIPTSTYVIFCAIIYYYC